LVIGIWESSLCSAPNSEFKQLAFIAFNARAQNANIASNTFKNRLLPFSGMLDLALLISEKKASDIALNSFS